MPVHCTFGDLDRLRNLPDQENPLSKLMRSTSPSMVDKVRILRLVQAVDAELARYMRLLEDLGDRHGNLVVEGRKKSWKIRPEKAEAFDASKKELDAVECVVPVDRLPSSALGDPTLTARDLALLEKFVVIPGD